MDYVHSIDKIPTKKHYVVFKGDSVYIPGDERSRTNPGHGYPGHTENYLSYIAFETKEEVEAYIARQRDNNYRVCLVTPISVSTKISISLDGG